MTENKLSFDSVGLNTREEKELIKTLTVEYLRDARYHRQSLSYCFAYKRHYHFIKRRSNKINRGTTRKERLTAIIVISSLMPFVLVLCATYVFLRDVLKVEFNFEKMIKKEKKERREKGKKQND